jgi:hypothetical protein
MKRRALLHRRERLRGTDEFLEGILIVRGNGGNGAGGEGGKEQTETASRHEHLHGPWLGRGDLAPYPAWYRGDATKQLGLAGNDARAT